MAEFKALSGMVGAGVVAGGLFVGVTTESDENDVVATGFIPWSIGVALHKGDSIAISNVDSVAGVVSRFYTVSSNSSNAITLGPLNTYGGSGLGNTPAGFNRKFLSGNIGAGSGSFNLYTYNNAADNLDDIAAAGYFNNTADILSIGDIIFVTSGSGAANSRGADLFKITNITVAGVVSVEVTDFRNFTAP